MSSDPMIGTTLGGYQLIERIGRGGMATVYLAYQESMRREVALKIMTLNEDASGDDDFRARFVQEAKMIAALEHIHVLPVYDFGIQDNVAYIAMRFLRGGSLADLIDDGPIEVTRAVELFLQFAKGLSYAHSKGMIHRDLKPTNILMDESGNAYLTDFGLAKFVDSQSNVTKTGNIVGTPAYMSPEQLRGDPIDYRSDVYSLGIVLYQMLTGQQPFSHETSDVVSVIYRNLEKQPPVPSALNPNIPLALQDIIFKAMQKNPADRYRSVNEMVMAVNQAMGLSAQTSDFPRPATLRQHPAPVNRMWLPFVLGISTLLLVAVVTVFVLGAARPNTPVFRPPNVQTGVTAELETLKPTQDEINAAQQAISEERFVGVMPCNQSSEYHSRLTREMTDFLRAYGIQHKVYNPDSDPYRQIALFETARAEGAFAFIVCPLDDVLLTETLRSLEEADAPLVLSATSHTYGGVSLYNDNFDMGVAVGRFTGELILNELGGEARVVVLTLENNEVVETRARGLISGLQEVAPQAEVVAEVRGATREWGKESLEKLLDEGTTFDVIMSINDAGSFGAIEALEEADVPYDSVMITSVDAEALALRYIEEGEYLRGSLGVARREFAQGAVDAMVKMLAGSPVPEFIVVPVGQIVTRENLLTESTE